MDKPALPETGLVEKLDSETYHRQHDRLSSHGAMKVLRSPAHFRASWGDDENKPEATPEMIFGAMLHTAILEPGDFKSRYTVTPDFGDLRTKIGREKRDAWMSDLKPGTIVIGPKDEEAITGMLNAVRAHPVANRLLSKGIAEVTGFWTDPETGARCRMRPDFITEDGMIVDYKTARDASPSAFSRAAFSYSYHVQAAFYLEGLSKIRKRPHDSFAFVVQEKTPPYGVVVYVPDDAFLDVGIIQVRKAMKVFKECTDANKWPGYEERAQNLSLPSWAFYQMED